MHVCRDADIDKTVVSVHHLVNTLEFSRYLSTARIVVLKSPFFVALERQFGSFLVMNPTLAPHISKLIELDAFI